MGIIEIEPICCEFLTLKWNPHVVNLLKMYVAIYQSLDEAAKSSSKSKVEASNTKGHSTVHRAIESITKHK